MDGRQWSPAMHSLWPQRLCALWHSPYLSPSGSCGCYRRWGRSDSSGASAPYVGRSAEWRHPDDASCSTPRQTPLGACPYAGIGSSRALQRLGVMDRAPNAASGRLGCSTARGQRPLTCCGGLHLRPLAEVARRRADVVVGRQTYPSASSQGASQRDASEGARDGARSGGL